MGGAAGHIKQIWEDKNLTIKDLRNIIDQSLNGTLENVSEKLDGQNIMVTYKNGKALLSRKAQHLRNYGENALDINATKDFFSKRGNPQRVEDMFVNALIDFQYLFDSDPQNFNDIFLNGKAWANVEIICRANENIIPYFKDVLIIHHIKTLDESGSTIDISNIYVNVQCKTFCIETARKPTLGFPNEILKQEIYNEFNNLIKGFNDSCTIEDIIKDNFLLFIKQNIHEDDKFNELLSNRWAKGIKEVNITKLIKYRSFDTKIWVCQIDNDIKQKYDEFKIPFIKLFSKLGIIVLKHLDNLMTNDEEKSIEEIKYKLLFCNTAEYLPDYHYKLWHDLGGLKSIVPTEGIVFSYNDNLYKLTGCFTPILRIIGLKRFGNENK